MEQLNLENIHKPVLLNETIHHIVTDKSGIYFDGTLGDGGHTFELLKRLHKNARIIGADIDSDSISFCTVTAELLKEKRLLIMHENYRNIGKITESCISGRFTGMLLDLGISSRQLDNPERGFSYMSDSDLDMRMDCRLDKSAMDIINGYDYTELYRVFREFGEIRFSSRLAKAIVSFRTGKSIRTTTDLLNIVRKFVKKTRLYSTASRVFQALRIEVNDELTNLRGFLESFIEFLKPGGRICIISYHSLEDRLVKESFKTYAKGCVCPKEFPECRCGKKKELTILTGKPVYPDIEEILQNPRARSARLRVAERIL